MTSKIPVGILGATGTVGQRFIQLLEDHPWFAVTWLAASERSAGLAYADASRYEELVGENIRGTPGIAARASGAIPNMNVRMISQGASAINISFVIAEDDVPEVIMKLHKAFFSDPDPEIFGERLHAEVAKR